MNAREKAAHEALRLAVAEVAKLRAENRELKKRMRSARRECAATVQMLKDGLPVLPIDVAESVDDLLNLRKKVKR